MAAYARVALVKLADRLHIMYGALVAGYLT